MLFYIVTNNLHVGKTVSINVKFHFYINNIFANIIFLIAEKKFCKQSPELDAALLEVLKTPVPQIDAVDGFLKTLGEVLRRLPYRKRVMLEIKFLQMTLDAESQETEENLY